MSLLKCRKNFLACCLLEAVEDEHLEHTELLIKKYKADCNFLIFQKGIAPIHYAAGMDNVEFAEKVMKIMLDDGRGDPNVPTLDNETPLHVASIHGRVNIVRLLLEKGGRIDIKDNEQKTPIMYAVYEQHIKLLFLFQTFVFEEKLKKNHEQNVQKLSKNKSVQTLQVENQEINKFTPNGKNYNFDATSPYYINITHRKKTNSKKSTSKDIPSIDLTEDEAAAAEIEKSNENSENIDECIIEIEKDLFQLNEKNVNEFIRCTPKHKSRFSFIDSWRHKIQPKKRTSIQTIDIDQYLNEFSTHITDKELATGVQLSSTLTIAERDKKLPSATLAATAIPSIYVQLDEDNSLCETFQTAVPDNESFFIRSPKLNTEFLCHMAEEYIHTDAKKGITFYETKISAEPVSFNKQSEKSYSSSSTKTEQHLPLDYDTERLRQELTEIGECPGPITKSTKRLYMKKLVKYKRDPESLVNRQKQTTEPVYSVELQKTLNENNWQETLKTYIHLEAKMTELFHTANKKNMLFREGNLKTSFIYILIDPRISENLPGKATLLSPLESWSKFLKSLFYIGKGKSSRPYSHLYDAIKLYNEYPDKFQEKTPPAKQSPKKGQVVRNLFQSPRKTISESKKLNRIIDIWRSEKGVVCLHVFHNIMPAEAYTREAAIIDAIGLLNLTNLKRGDYYGPSKTWDMRTRKQLGAFILYKAFQIFLAEGESQLKPSDIK